ncbi:MAG: ATP-binding protein [Cyanophyceae cyanobacterium]
MISSDPPTPNTDATAAPKDWGVAELAQGGELSHMEGFRHLASETLWLLGELASELSGAQTLDQIQLLLSRKLRWIINFERCTLAIWHHPAASTYELRELSDPQQALQSGSQWLSFGTDWISNVLQSSKPLLGDPTADPWFKPYQSHSTQPGIIEHPRSLLLLPLRTGSRTVGSLNLSARSQDVYPLGIRNLVMLLASQLGGHLGAALHHRQTQIRLTQQSAVADLGQRALEGADLDSLMTMATEAVITGLGIPSAQIWSGMDPQALQVQVVSGWWPLLSSLRLGFSDLTQGPCPPPLTAIGIQSSLGIPFYSADGMTRILTVQDLQPRHFTDEDISFLQLVVQTLDTALLRQQSEHNRLHAERNAQLEAQMKEMQRLERLKDQFLSTVSHELRTPLTSIKLSIQLLQSTALTAQQSRYVEILQQETQREIKLVQDLLVLQDPILECPIRQTLSVSAWLGALTIPFAQRAKLREQHLQLQIPEPPADAALAVVTDPDLLEQVVAELLTNAIKFTPRQGQIEVGYRQVSSDLILWVSNSGPEIPPLERERIFERFYRLPQRDPWAEAGTGLGLSLAQQRIQQLNGTIQVGRKDELTLFEVRIPLQPPSTPTTTAAEPPGLSTTPDQDPDHQHRLVQATEPGSDGWEDSYGWSDLLSESGSQD